eukprot:6286-Prymnesium_polylepis.3
MVFSCADAASCPGNVCADPPVALKVGTIAGSSRAPAMAGHSAAGWQVQLTESAEWPVVELHDVANKSRHSESKSRSADIIAKDSAGGALERFRVTKRDSQTGAASIELIDEHALSLGAIAVDFCMCTRIQLRACRLIQDRSVERYFWDSK